MRGFLIEEQPVGFRFCFRLGKTASETPEMLRTLSLTKPMLVHTHLCDFLDSDLGKLQLKTVIVGRPSTGRTEQNVVEVSKMFTEYR